MVDFDQRDEDKTSANVLILGNSGQGKSYLMKLLLLNFLETGKSVITLDVEHEQWELCQALGGCFADIIEGTYKINLLEPRCWDTDADPYDVDAPKAFRQSTRLAQHTSFLKDVFRTYKDFTTAQIDTIEIMLTKLYTEWGITEETDFSQMRPEDYPILSELYDFIEIEYENFDETKPQLYTRETLQQILLGLHSMCRGADSKFFNGHTNLTSTRFLVFGVKGLLSVAQNVRSTILLNLLSYMSDKLLTEGNTVAALDELYIWLSNPVAIEYIRNSLKRVRKKESALVLASQNLEDFDQPGVREMTKPLFSIPVQRRFDRPPRVYGYAPAGGQRVRPHQVPAARRVPLQMRQRAISAGSPRAAVQGSAVRKGRRPLMAVSPMLIKVAAALLTSEKGRKGVGFLLVAIFAPVILIAAILCSTTSGGADHNNSTVEASFYGVTYSEDVPDEFRTHIADMQTAFSLLDSAVAEANANMTDGNRLDPIQVKAIFYALCFGENAPSQRAADRFVDCLFITEQRTRTVLVELEDGSVIEQEEPYTATVPLSLAAAYENLAAKLGRAVTDEDKENAAHIYTMIAGNANGSDGTGASGGTIQIDYGYGGGSTELDTSGFTNPAGKNADDLVQYALHAYQEHWGYVWGTFGHVLTESLFEAKLAQYPDALAGNADFIRQTWVGGRTTDCVGLIKGYGWLDAETEEIVYNTNGMPDITANEMYHAATASGTIDTIPETPGLAVWHDGHIGVYIGNGEVVEAMGTRYGVVKTKLEGARWTHWLKIPYISYD